MDLLTSLVLCDRKIEKEKITSILANKIFEYYNYLTTFKAKYLNSDDINFVTDTYDKVMKQISYLDDEYINHGDLSEFNMITSKGKTYIIDFDETSVTYELYDFANIVVKNFTDKKGNFDEVKVKELANNVRKAKPQYLSKDLNNIIMFYLCKILLEKFYLHETEKIDLFSKDQMKDDYNRYLKMLKDINEMGLIHE
ncbi:MAG: phosphotransferase [Clostridia bacterium]|nr:phosphotransferase [Clostridia bacterium]